MLDVCGRQALHARLGEPITAEEAVKAVASMTGPGKTVVTFDDFAKYWDREHFECVPTRVFCALAKISGYKSMLFSFVLQRGLTD
jgi:hypothetical protein